MPHPLDVNYQGLKATLTHLKKEEEEYDIIQQYLAATGPTWHNVQILDVFRVDREGEVGNDNWPPRCRLLTYLLDAPSSSHPLPLC